MASSKNTKRNAEAAADPSKMSNLERLILVQAVYEFGNNAWPEVSKLLSSHPMLAQSKLRFSPQFCNIVYLKLMQDAGLECPAPLESRKAIIHRQLAKIHYDKRVDEVRALLLAEESRFRKIVGEIDEIRAGLWDNKILRGGSSPAADLKQPSSEPDDIARDTNVDVSEQPEQETEPMDEEESPVIEDSAEDLEGEADVQSPNHDTAAEADVHETTPSVEDEIVEDNITENEDVALETVEVVDQAELSTEHEHGSRSISVQPVQVDDSSLEQGEEEEFEVGEPERAVEAQAEEEEEESEHVQEADSDSEAGTKSEAVHEPEPEVEIDADIPVVSDVEQPTRVEGKRKASEALSEPPRDRKRLREESEPADEDEQGPSTTKGRRKTQGVADKKFQNVIGMLHSTISQHRYGNIFHHPIKKSEAADYHDIVKRPMDLKTIKARVKDGLISNSLEFQRDIYLMFANAMMYNRPGSEIYNMAEEMMLESEIHINSFRQTEGFHRS